MRTLGHLLASDCDRLSAHAETRSGGDEIPGKVLGREKRHLVYSSRDESRISRNLQDTKRIRPFTQAHSVLPLSRFNQSRIASKRAIQMDMLAAVTHSRARPGNRVSCFSYEI